MALWIGRALQRTKGHPRPLDDVVPAFRQAAVLEGNPTVDGLRSADVVVPVPDEGRPLFSVRRFEFVRAGFAIGVAPVDFPFVADVKLWAEAVAREAIHAFLDAERFLHHRQLVKKNLFDAALDEHVDVKSLLRARGIGFEIDIHPFAGPRDFLLSRRLIERDGHFALPLLNLELSGKPIKLVRADADALGELEEIFFLGQFAFD